MKRTILTQAIVILALFITTIGLHGQVTIGSGEKPRTGALLDLTEGAITTRGLKMPRVELTNLKPTTPAELSASIGGTGNWVLADHTALAVYNTKESDHCAVEPIHEGLYVFDGEQWQFLGKKGSTSAAVYEVIDPRDNQVYLARNFGSTAGDWMLENLRYIPNNTDAGFTGFTHTAAVAPSPYTAKYWSYPWKGDGSGNTPYNATQAEADWDPRTGVLYNWSAATNGENSETIDQGQVAGTVPGANEVEVKKETIAGAKNGKIRGICPPNWHVPTDREWNALEKELTEHASDYSATANSTWPATWETGTYPNPGYGWRGTTHGEVIKSECELPGHTYGSPNGKSFSTAQGGFNAILTGFAYNGDVSHYGYGFYSWTASTYNSGTVWQRGVHGSGARVARDVGSHIHLFSVRCKKDD
ncbi:FISUMP domain-containing protein [Dysgonomonas sp. 25]|uniref:FISUMP domain-containing protein n=1 Tax=Dysgonomonas sp. 25 TaxID=2302933 RepID=UPI0013CF889A|nr:FISUMP domain-containing protein [Dysgonomonas sp. 25]NDV70239.1 hypothetical protein [Dysgonomonas sp. 25]